jgi:3-hydroxyisobutyrate dehydrogenase-like beta-hydroxyacid dehydrogenase
MIETITCKERSTDMKVGFIGLGTMGLPMVKNLLKAGWEVTVISRSRGPVEEALSLGAKEAASPKELAAESNIVLTCLPKPDTIETIYFGPSGLLAGINEGTILVDHSTVSPDLNRRIEEQARQRGAHFLDAPISGGPMGASAGTLAIMVGGKKSVYDQALPVLQSMGRHVVHLGPVGSGSVVKLINNSLVAIHTAALSEAFVVGAKAGISSEAMYSVIKHSTGHSFMMDRVLPLIQDRDFNPRFSVKLLHKDMGLAVSMTEQLGLSAEWTKNGAEALQATMELGCADEDIAAIVKVFEKEAGQKV